MPDFEEYFDDLKDDFEVDKDSPAEVQLAARSKTQRADDQALDPQNQCQVMLYADEIPERTLGVVPFGELDEWMERQAGKVLGVGQWSWHSQNDPAPADWWIVQKDNPTITIRAHAVEGG